MSLRERVDRLAKRVAPTYTGRPLADLTDAELDAALADAGLSTLAGFSDALRALPDNDIRYLNELADRGPPQRFADELERLTGRSWP